MNRRFLCFAAPLLLGLSLAGCMSGDHAHNAGPVSVDNAVVYPPLPGRDVALGTFVLKSNSGADDVLLSASSPVSDRVEIHTHVREGEVMKMRRLDSLDIPAGAAVTFERGGYHLMMFGAELPSGAKIIPVTLTFKTAGNVTVSAAVDGRADAGDKAMDHSGH